MNPLSARIGASLLWLTVCLGNTALPAAETTYWSSRDGLYRITYESELTPIVINRIHRWTLRLEDANGNPVTGADIRVSGGMPIHDHGLPTQPRVTEDLGTGEYRLEGVRFHMAGSWRIELRIAAAPGSDVAVIPVEL